MKHDRIINQQTDDLKARRIEIFQATGLTAIIRQKSHVLENFSIDVNNKILTQTFQERLPQKHFKTIRVICEIWKKNRNYTPWNHWEKHTIFGERDSLYRTPRYFSEQNGISGFKTSISRYYRLCFRSACRFLNCLLVSFFVFCNFLQYPFPQRNWHNSRVPRKLPYNPTVSNNCLCLINDYWPVETWNSCLQFFVEIFLSRLLLSKQWDIKTYSNVYPSVCPTICMWQNIKPRPCLRKHWWFTQFSVYDPSDLDLWPTLRSNLLLGGRSQLCVFFSRQSTNDTGLPTGLP